MALLNLQEENYRHWARYSAIVIFAIMAVTDGLDGFLARRLKQETLAGKFLDPLADKLLILCSVILLAHEGTHVGDIHLRIPTAAAVIAVGKDIIVVLGFCIIYFTTSRIFIQPNHVGKFCTGAQLLMVLSILLMPDLPRSLIWLPRFLWWLASILAIFTVITYFQAGRRFLAHHGEGQLPL